MDSYFNTQLGRAPRRRAQAPARAAGQAATQPAGYRLSSDDLNTGLEVRTISISTLPLEVVAELVRMRRLWDGVEVQPNPG